MAPSSRIPTPLKQHLHRFRVGLLPVMSFILCVILTVWLWQRQGVTGAVTGEVEAVLVEVPAGVDGELRMPPSGHYWELFDEVEEGQPLAYLDDRLIQARMDTIRSTKEQLEAELEQTAEEFKLDQANLVQRRRGDIARLQLEKDRRIDALEQQKAAGSSLRKQQEELSKTLEALERSVLVDPGDVLDARRDLSTIEGDIQTAARMVIHLKKQIADLQRQLDQYPPIELAEVATVLAPIRKEIALQDKLLQEIQVERDNCVIRAPIDGVISMIHRYPGQRVGAADPIVTIARKESDYVVGYVREQQRIPLYEGMEVGLRLRNQPNSPEYTSWVDKVSPQVTTLPLDRLADQNVMEFATWIRIPIPKELKQQKLRPRQLVQVIFRSPRRSE